MTPKQAWGRRFTGSLRQGLDTPYATVFSPDGSKVFVTGTTQTNDRGDSDMLTIAYDAGTGATLWMREFPGVAAYRGSAITKSTLAISPDGSKLFVTAPSTSSNGGDYVTIAYNPSNGSRVWFRRFDSTAHGDDNPTAIAVSPDGSTVFVTGTSIGSTTSEDFATVAYDASTGAKRWIRRYTGPGNGPDYARAIAISPDSTTVYVTGGTAVLISPGSNETKAEYATLAYDAATGAQLWVSRFDGPIHGGGTAYAIGVSPDGSKVYVGGKVLNEAAGINLNYDYGTVAYDASNGTQLWSDIYVGTNHDLNDTVSSLAVGPNGTVYVTGTSEHPDAANGHDDGYATIAYSPAGSRLWVTRYDGAPGSNHDPRAITVTLDGSEVIITGGETLAYTPLHGYLIWQCRGGFALALSADSSHLVVVSPVFDGSIANTTDWSTIDYAFS